MLTIGKGRNRRTEYPGLVNPFAYYLSTLDFVLSYVHEFYDIMDAARRYGASGGTKMAYASSAAVFTAQLHISPLQGEILPAQSVL